MYFTTSIAISFISSNPAYSSYLFTYEICA